MVPQVVWLSPTEILPMTLPCLICLRPWSVRPWLWYGWRTCLGQMVNVGWLDPWKPHIWSRPRHFRWWVEHIHCCLVNLAVRQCKVFDQFEVLREPISCPALQSSMCTAHEFEVFAFLTRLVRVYVRAISPTPNRVSCCEEAITLAKSLSSCQYCTRYKISTSIDAQRFDGKNDSEFVFCVWCDCCTWIVYDLWSVEVRSRSMNQMYCCVGHHTTQK